MRVEQFAMAGVEYHEILDKISKNEKEGHSDTSQGNPKAVRWKDRRDVYILTNTHAPLLKEISPKNLGRLSNLVL